MKEADKIHKRQLHEPANWHVIIKLRQLCELTLATHIYALSSASLRLPASPLTSTRHPAYVYPPSRLRLPAIPLTSTRLQTEDAHIPRLLLLRVFRRLRHVAIVLAPFLGAEVVAVAMAPAIDKLRTQLRLDVKEPAVLARTAVAWLRW